MAERWYLDQPFVLERTVIEQARALLRPLARTSLSPLPNRMRTRIAHMYRQLGEISRELRRAPDRVMREKADEADQEPPA